MGFKSSLVTLVAGAAVAMAAINPLTITALSPEQSSALVSAFAPLATSVENDPAWTSIFSEIETNATAYSVYEAASATLANVPVGVDYTSVLSVINLLPSDAASYLRSLASEELAVASSVLNNDVSTMTTTSETVSMSTQTGGKGGSTITTTTSAAAQSTNAAPTGSGVRAAGVAAGLFIGAVAML